MVKMADLGVIRGWHARLPRGTEVGLGQKRTDSSGLNKGQRLGHTLDKLKVSEENGKLVLCQH